MKYMPYSVTKVNNKIHYVVLVESGGRQSGLSLGLPQ